MLHTGEQIANMVNCSRDTFRCCTVTIHDLNEVAHSLDLAAGTLYETAAQALPGCPAMNGSLR